MQINKIYISIFLAVIMIISGCSEKDDSLAVAEITDEKEIEEVIKNFEYDMVLMGYMPIKVFQADLNDDDIYEIYASSVAGSGIGHAFVECYEPVTETYSYISERLKIDYYFYVYEDELYIISTQHMLSSFYQQPSVYRLILVDDKLSYEAIDEELEEDILDSYNEVGMN